MRRSSKIALVAAAVLVVLVAAILIPALTASDPDFTEPQARAMLDRLQEGFRKNSTAEVLAQVDDKAMIARRNVEQINNYLRSAFANTKNLAVEFKNMQYQRHGDEATIDTEVYAGELPPGKTQMTEGYYGPALVRIVVKKRRVPQLFGLLRATEWRITEVDAPHIPNIDNAPGQ